MKLIKSIFITALLSTVPFISFAQTVSVSAITIDCAEAMIAKKAQEAGATSYKIISASTGNFVHMTAKLIK